MSKSSMLSNKKNDSLPHLYKGKWELGKTVTIRIPLVLKNELLQVAQYFDKDKKYESINQPIMNYFEKENIIKNKIENLEIENEKLKQELDRKNKIIDLHISDSYSEKKDNKYQIGLDCFTEYLAENNIKISESKKPRKGTILRELLNIKSWLKNKCSTL